MTLEELKNNLDTLISLHETLEEIHESTDTSESIALEKFILATMRASREFIQRPTLRKWTAGDGSPPDGLYLTKAWPGGKVAHLLPDPVGDPCVYFITDEGHEAIYPIKELWEQFSELYGPIEAEGETG